MDGLMNSIMRPPAANVFASEKPATSTKRRETAWLDGLRGIAAILVVLHHISPGVMFLGNCHNAELGHGETAMRLHTPAAWPFIRLFFTGGSIAVEVFFVISGYVVPRRLLSLLQQGRHSDFVEALNSAVIRRPARLLLPAFASVFMVVAFHTITGIEPSWGQNAPPSILKAFWWWILDCLQLANYFESFASEYHRVLWTVVVEFKGSMALFTWLFAIHQMRTQWRVWSTLSLVTYLVFFAANIQYAAFFAGMVTSELDLLNASSHSESVWIPGWTRLCNFLAERRVLRSAVLHSAPLVALILASTPVLQTNVSSDKAVAQCEWPQFLWYMVPWQYWSRWPMGSQRDFWYFWSAWLIVVTIKEIDWAKSALESRAAQYLGKHSFSIYLTHVLVTGTLTKSILILTGFTWLRGANPQWPYDRMPAGAWKTLLPNDVGPHGFTPAEIFTTTTSLIPIVFLGEIGTRFLDEPSVWASQYIWDSLKKHTR